MYLPADCFLFYFVAASGDEQSENPLGPLSLFSFLTPLKEEHCVPTESTYHLREVLESRLHKGVFLNSKENGVLFPLIHITNDRNSIKKKLTVEHVLNNEYTLLQGVYREVRSIRPEEAFQNGYTISNHNNKNTAFILLGFKSMDKSFSKEVMVDSWKDWTGARYIYLYLPDDLGLRRISFYHREAPYSSHSTSMFLYLMLVECSSVSTKEHQVRLLDFAQRLRAEKVRGYVSVYGVTTTE